MKQFKFDIQLFAGGTASATSASTYSTTNHVPGTQYAWSSDHNTYLNTQRATGAPGVDVNGSGIDLSKLPITSTNVSIWSNGQRVGFVQSFTPSESRDITPIQELGTEGVVQMVPGNTRGGQIQLNRVAVYNSDLFNALGLTRTGQFVKLNPADTGVVTGNATSRSDNTARTYGNPFRTLKDQRVPLELRADTQLPGGNKHLLREIYCDCWISSYSKTIQAQQVWVTETATAEYSDLESFIISPAQATN